MQRYAEFFSTAHGGRQPFPWQERLATADPQPDLLDIPTGLGKSAGVILGWMWRWYRAEVDCPRRLVFCLPMRTLVEQTAEAARGWTDALQAVFAAAGRPLPVVHVLRGGESDAPWDIDPEQPLILVGTQDMLLSRALNRGYALSRYRWPMHFGLLNNDCLWVMDETQLMGVGLATTAQLAGLRRKLGTLGPTGSLWMSATLGDASLDTVDHVVPSDGRRCLRLDAQDLVHEAVRARVHARKGLARVALHSDGSPKDQAAWVQEVADLIRTRHAPGTLTLVVVNRVARAQALHEALAAGFHSTPERLLVHSRFRAGERAAQLQSLRSDAPMAAGGRIVVATQAVEAGVDISARLLVTELCPWSSFVQRVGRCNRYGEHDHADVVVLDLLADVEVDSAASRAMSLPYPEATLRDAQQRLQRLIEQGDGCGPQAVRNVPPPPEEPPLHVIRRKDLLDLFDTVPDMSGFDLDVSRYIRDGEDRDVFLAWRSWDVDERTEGSGEATSLADQPPLRDAELVRAPLFQVREILKKWKPTAGERPTIRPCAWTADTLSSSKRGTWTPLRPESMRPGMILLLHASFGGYTPSVGLQLDYLDHRSRGDAVPSVVVDTPPGLVRLVPDTDATAIGADPLSIAPRRAITLREHTDHVCSALDPLLEGLSLPEDAAGALRSAARWHDAGKGHPWFQRRLTGQLPDPDVRTPVFAKSGSWSTDPIELTSSPEEDAAGTLEEFSEPNAASSAGPTEESGFDGDPHAQGVDAAMSTTADDLGSARVGADRAEAKARRLLRHEFASALLYLQHHAPAGPHPIHDLVTWLIACHHGKVRLSLRPMPGEELPGPPESFPRVLGLWNGDVLPALDLGADVSVPPTTLDLSVVALGAGSWADRMVRLRDAQGMGPFRLALLEAVLRAADQRASRDEVEASAHQRTA